MARDRELGLFTRITRRDLLHGMGVAALGATARPFAALAEGEPASDGYPPARSGMRGSHAGSFEVAHERAWNGREWRDAALLDESYDLVVVGGGISGLAAAWFYRRHVPDARILILDNHDDFGGHAKRNEFVHAGRRHLAVGGSVFLEYASYGEVTHGLLRELGVDIERLRARQERGFLWNPFELGSGVHFDAASFGVERLVTGDLLPLARLGPNGEVALKAHVEQMPIPRVARRKLARFLHERNDYFDEVPDARKPEVLARISYDDFLRQRAGLPEDAARVFRRYPNAYWGVGTESLSVLDALESGLPGWNGLGAWGHALEKERAGAFDRIEGAWFPDGNASLARLLVRGLVPGVAPGHTQEDVVDARFDYGRLDVPGARVRVRLSSTAVHVDQGPGSVDVTYVRAGNARRVRAGSCVLACYHAMIPYLCPELPEEQKQALRYGEKAPLLSSNVLLREGRVLQRLGAGAFYSPGRLHSTAFALGPSLGRYEGGWDPAAPVVLHMLAALTPSDAQGTLQERLRVGRRRLLEMSFQSLEREIREHLAGMLGGAGFDAARDVLGLTINRWPHGYAYDPGTLFEPGWPEGQAPNEIARRRFGRLAIANSDAGYHAYVDGAVDQAHRAVQELAAAKLLPTTQRRGIREAGERSQQG